MKFYTLLLLSMFVLTAAAQESDKKDYSEEFKLLAMQVKKIDIDKLSDSAQKRASIMADNICKCVSEHQTTIDDFSAAITTYVKAKKSEDKADIAAAKKGLDDLMNTLGAFMKCTMENDKKYRETDANKALKDELLKLYPEHAEHIERMVVIKNRYVMHYIEQNCQDNHSKFELLSNFMFGLMRGRN